MSKVMKQEQFELQLIMLGLVPKLGSNLDDIYSKYEEMNKQYGEISYVMSDLWKYLEPEKITLEWTEIEFKPEDSIQKRAIVNAEKIVGQIASDYPKFADFKKGDDWNHIIKHGKCGLMSILFALEKHNPDVKIKDIAPIIECFMDEIEKLFESLIGGEHRAAICKCLNIIDNKDEFKDLIHGRLQPFTMMRGVYLEADIANLSPLQWWVQSERYIPNLPE
jgi:hypothetical protein